MMLKTQKRLAGKILKCSPNRAWFDPDRLDEVKEAITKANVRGLISSGAIIKQPTDAQSRGRMRLSIIQKRKGRGKEPSKRKGKATARRQPKRDWMNKVRLLRTTLNEFKDKDAIAIKDYRSLYMKVKGGFFRSKRHLSMYIEEQGMLKKNNG
jgi:large subunit ribosomal protein L19e